MAKRWLAVVALALLASSCSLDLELEDDAEQSPDAPRARVGGNASLVIEDALVVAGEDAITVHPTESDPVSIRVEEPVVDTFDDGAGGLVYVSQPQPEALAVRHLPAGSEEAYTLAEDLSAVFDVGIYRGLPAVIGATGADPAARTMVAVQLDGTRQDLFPLPPTAVSVQQGGQRLVIGHVDRAASPPCSWIEVLDMTGAAQPAPSIIPSEPICAEGRGALPVTSLSDDGRRLGIAGSTEAGNEVRIVDLDLGTEKVVVVPDVQSLRLGLAGGLVVSSQGVVELSETESNQSWLRPFPPETTSADHFQRIEAPLQLNADVARGEPVTMTAAAPPGATPPTGEVLLAPGSTGEVVIDWQRRLNRWLAVSSLPDVEAIPRTGVYDPATQGLTTLFLQAAQLPDDGSIDTRDLDELNRLTAALESSVGVVQRGDRGEIVEGWQAQLAAWVEGAQPEDVPSRIGTDGVFGKGTEEATLAFETATGNRADGIVQPIDRTAMAAALAEIESGVAPPTTG